jgi:predicted N-acetyltransferase YhbS
MCERKVRFERHTDHEAVDALHRAAFGEHGARVVSLLNDLRAVRGAVSLAAGRYGAVVGHV